MVRSKTPRARSIVVQQCQPTLTTEGDEVIGAEVIVAFETSGHGEKITPVETGGM